MATPGATDFPTPGGPIYVSTNSGGTWTPTSTPSFSWSSVVCSADGSKLVAVANGGIYSSVNSGITWTSNSVPMTNWSRGAGGPGGVCFEGDGSAASGNPGYPGNAGGGGINSLNTIAQNSIVAANNLTSSLSAFQYGPDVVGPVSSLGRNLIGQTNGNSGFINGGNGDLAGTTASPLDPKLGPLQNNGGPTFTMALLPGSPAIDQGASGGLTTDQRGRLRPLDNPAIANAGGGDGSDIGAFELQSPAPVFTGLQKSGSDILLNFLSEVGQNYRVERTDSLAPTNWTTVADNLPGTGSSVQVIDLGAANQPQRFYRGRTLP